MKQLKSYFNYIPTKRKQCQLRVLLVDTFEQFWENHWVEKYLYFTLVDVVQDKVEILWADCLLEDISEVRTAGWQYHWRLEVAEWKESESSSAPPPWSFSLYNFLSIPRRTEEKTSLCMRPPRSLRRRRSALELFTAILWMMSLRPGAWLEMMTTWRDL